MLENLTTQCVLCRREGVKLYLKGRRCEGPMCGLTRRQSIPGQHGGKRTSRLSDYGKQLREKQRVKRYYGLREKQFKIYYEQALKSKGNTGELLLIMLERRLDNVAYRLGWGLSRPSSRQIIKQGKVLVNGKKITSPSFILSKGDSLQFEGQETFLAKTTAPAWLERSEDSKKAKITRLPERSDIAADIDEQLIVEFYSR